MPWKASWTPLHTWETGVIFIYGSMESKNLSLYHGKIWMRLIFSVKTTKDQFG